MRGSSALVAASMVAASTVALTSSSSANVNKVLSSSNNRPSKCASSDKEKFAPRFDGLRFIETLVTAHR
ncbi:hypothetical protein LWI29_019285 [Acer saccharum]|uniref:Uncharacterized protein n=1 Tax=Acer saccharum TaxID=4024 RepID=A0AA39VJ35_ACESA|nr:hypothetical protein LWI29_019285 [Acer saccharum]